MKYLILALIGVAAIQAAVVPSGLKGQALVDHINTNAKTWHAKLNTKFKIKNRLMRSQFVKMPATEFGEEVPELVIEAPIPDTFDARTNWPNCKSLLYIRDQSDCGSCWAFAAVECMTDRICIANGGSRNDMLAADDVLSCCGNTCGDGCEGGYPIQAWKYWVHQGVCTGSSFQENSGCKPYPIAPCGHHNKTYFKKCPDELYPTPTCEKQCQAGYPISYDNDKHYGKSAYKVSKSVSAIQKEIMTYGPVEAAYIVYTDFEHYKGGVYQHTYGEEAGGHAVKLMGWGTDNGTPYWLVANSWDTDWGENGFFRIRRGYDECGIEDGIVAGVPK